MHTLTRLLRKYPQSLLAYSVYGLAAAFLCYEMALQVSPSVMTEHLMRDLNIDASGLGLMASCYFWSYTGMQIPAGLLFDRFSARLLITSSLLICVAGALFFGITETAYFAAIGRFFMGVGSAFAFIGVLVMAARWFSPQYFAFLVGIAQFLAAMGAMSGEVPLAAAVEAYGWRHTIHAIAAVGALLAVLIWLVVRDYPEGAESKSHVAKNIGVKKSLGYILTESQTWWVALYAFASWAPISVFASLWGVPYLKAMYNVSGTMSSTLMAMAWIGLGVTSPMLGWFSDKLGRRRILLSSCALVGFICAMIVLYVPGIPFRLMFIILFGFGFAAAGQILSFAVVRDNNRPEVTATAIGFNNMAVVAGGALFQPLVGVLLDWHWSGQMIDDTKIYSVANYQVALSVVPICFLAAFVASLFFIKETYCQPKYPQ